MVSFVPSQALVGHHFYHNGLSLWSFIPSTVSFIPVQASLQTWWLAVVNLVACHSKSSGLLFLRCVVPYLEVRRCRSALTYMPPIDLRRFRSSEP